VSDPLLRTSEVTGERLMIAMADFHYTPNPDGPTQQLLTTLKNLDCMSRLLRQLIPDDTILDYQFPELNETYTIPADLQPLPQFSDRRLPLVYNFKLSQATALTDHQDPITGEVRQRYYNTARHIGFSPITVGHMNPNIPMEPEAKVRARMPKLNQAILEKMRLVSSLRIQE
jgi:general transcription factor 3C polypeptide 5 (transcription factor C subunit 1)